MATTKKTEDYTKNPQATTKEDVDSQDTATRLWQSLGYSYGKQREESDQGYDKAISQTDRQSLSRGMQRSSYNTQILANLQNQKQKASNDIYSAQIADYQNRMQQLDEAEAARKFQTSEREAQQAWQSGENALAREFQTKEREAQQTYNTSERIAQQIYNTGEREAQQKWQGEENEKNRAYQTKEREAQQNYNTSERIAQQIYNTGEREAQQIYNTKEREAQQAYNAEQSALAREFQAGESALDRAQNQTQFDINMAFQEKQAEQQQKNTEIQQAFQEKQWQAQQDQWREEFDYNKMTQDQKIAFEVIGTAAANGTDVSDALLKQAGISREDYNAMKKQASGGGKAKTTGNDNTNGNNQTPTADSLINGLTNYNKDVTANAKKGIVDVWNPVKTELKNKNQTK